MAMTFPIRCFTCGKVINCYWDAYARRKEKEHPDAVLDSLHIFRECCRRMFRSHVEERDEQLLIYRNPIARMVD